MGQIQSLEDLIGLLIRRRLLIGAITVFGIVISLLYAITKPTVFESTAVIQVQSATVASPDSTASAVASSAQRLQAIQQRLTTRDNMLEVITRHALYADTPLTDDEKVHLLRMSLRFETVASASATGHDQAGEVSALLIVAQGDTGAKAARVANDFAQGVLDAGVSEQLERAREAVSFFREEERNLSATIEAHEAEIAQYEAQNLDALPAQRDLLRLELPTLETELRSLTQALVAARNERATIAQKPNLRATDQRQLDTITAQLETLAAQSTALTTRRTEIIATLTKAQEVDRTLADYERDLTRLRNEYALVSRRSIDAETAAKLQDRQQGESFTLLERAAKPDNPISGGRRKLAMAGAVASLLLAVIVAFALDHMRPILRTRSQLERELDLRPIVAIPEVKATNRQGFMQNLRPLSNISPPIPDMVVKTAGPANDTTGISRKQTLIGVVAVLLLVAVAAAIT